MKQGIVRLPGFREWDPYDIESLCVDLSDPGRNDTDRSEFFDNKTTNLYGKHKFQSKRKGKNVSKQVVHVNE